MSAPDDGRLPKFLQLSEIETGFRLIDGVAYVPLVRRDGFVACHLNPIQAMLLAHLMRADHDHASASEKQMLDALEQVPRFIVVAWSISPELAMKADREVCRLLNQRPMLDVAELARFAEALERLAAETEGKSLGREVFFQNCADELRQIARRIEEKEGPDNR